MEFAKGETSNTDAHGEACRPDEGRIDIGAGCPVLSMVRESYVCIIGDAPTGGQQVAVPEARQRLLKDPVLEGPLHL